MMKAAKIKKIFTPQKSSIVRCAVGSWTNKGASCADTANLKCRMALNRWQGQRFCQIWIYQQI